MQFQRKSTCVKGIKVLLILLMTYTVSVSGSVTQEEIDAAREIANDAMPVRYCGKRLTEAMKHFCSPRARQLMKQPSKKSLDSLYNTDFDLEFDVDRVAAENYDDSMRYDGTVNDFPLVLSSQRNRRRRGIIDDCCKRACYKSELMTYCPIKG